jgi:Fe-S-cluster-containing dehydrogenase component
MSKKTSRRKFLRKIATGLPAIAAGGAATHIGLTALSGNGPKFPGEPGTWKSKFLAEAVAERGGAAPSDIIDVPARPIEVPMVMDYRGGAVAVRDGLRHEGVGESTTLRMQDDLARAMEKPIDQRKWAMVIDLEKCIGCSACTIACKAENHTPPGVVYNPVLEEEVGEYPNVRRVFMPRPCQQCDDPPCVPVCPVNATWKREDGIIVIDYNACIGCRYCLAACPYGARYFDFGDHYTDGTPALQPYEEAPGPEYGKEWTRNGDSSPVGNARKCQFCIHRLDAGMLPACVVTCIGGAMHFGDKNDPESLVSEMIGSPRVKRLKEELGTDPKVYYLA